MHPAPQRPFRIVQSPANQWVKALRAAITHPPALARAGSAAEPAYLALEGFHMIAEAIASGLAPVALFFRSGEEHDALRALESALLAATSLSASLAIPAATELMVLPPALFAALVDTEAPRPLAALLAAPHSTLDALLTPPSGNPLLLVLAALQDPGNVGTLLRSAEAFGATGAILLAGTATPYSSKALRASAGSALRLPLLAMAHAGEAALLLRRHGIRSFAAVVSGGGSVSKAALAQPAALWIGNEGAGLSAKELALCDQHLTLQMPGRTESLNAAVAGSLLLYEAARQRSASKQT